MNPVPVNIMGMTMDRWKFRSCTAHFGVGKDWATLYEIESLKEGKGHASFILERAKKYYEKQGKKVGGSVALNKRMKDLYERFGYEEYN